jgi:hypothetical protein
LRSFAIFILVLAALCLIGCGGSGGGTSTPGPTPTPIAPTPTPTPIPTPSPSPTPGSVAVTVSPGKATVAAGGTQQFTSTVSGSNNAAVTWQVNGVIGGNAVLGTIEASGLYHSPSAPPSAPIVVTAIAQADTTKTAEAQIIVTFSNASITGEYVFFVNVGTRDPALAVGPAFVYAAGSFHADGKGNITAGVEDENTRLGGPVTDITFTGSYTITADGRGIANITAGTTVTPFKFVLTSSDRGQLLEFDGFAAASGFVLRQDPNAIANVTGAYVFSMLGEDSGFPTGAIGRLISDGAGNLIGSEILNDGGTRSLLSLTGTYTVGSTGRGLATVSVGTSFIQHFVFYIVNATTVQFVSTDVIPTPRIAGTALLQTGVGSSIGSSVFFVNGMFVQGGLFTAIGRFDTDGAGTLTGGVFDSFSPNDLTGTPLGTYSINADGSGQISVLNPGPAFDFWMFSPTQAVLLTRATIPGSQSAVATGFIFAEQGGPFTPSQFNGNYAFGVALDSGQAATGQITSDGIGTFTGNEDLSTPGVLPDEGLSATWTFAANGKGSGSVTTSGSLVSTTPILFYPINANEIVFSNNAAMGLAEKQCSDCH